MATTKNITMKQFNGTDYDTLYPKTVYNQVSGVAPAGYGLGETLPYIAKTSESGEFDADTIDKTGFFAARTNTPTGNWCYGLHVNRIDNMAFQLLTSEFSEKEFALRKKISGVWQPWEWVNPPMQLGVEYRTIERYLGKPVYVKVVNCGAVPDNTTKTINLNASNVDVPLSATGYLARTSDTYKFSVPYLMTDINKAITQGVSLSLRNDNNNTGTIFVQTHNTFSSEYTLYVIARYTKTTD